MPKIVPEEAEIVRLIFKQFMQGKSYSAIAKHLTAQGIPSPMNKPKWGLATVRNILQNETYRGSKRLQKTLTVDFLTKTKKVNEGELPSYYIEESHEPIIPPDEFDAVQAEIERRKTMGRPMSCQSPFSTKIICGDCGAYFGRKVWSSNTQYRRTIWRCNDRYNKRGKRDCKTSHVTENDVKDKFLSAFNKLAENRSSLIEDCRLAQKALCNLTEIDAEIVELEREIEIVEELSLKAINENARQAIDQSEWVKRNGIYLKRHDKATKRILELDVLKKERVGKSKTLEMFIKGLEQREQILTEFDEELWSAVVDSVVVGVDKKLTFRFKDGTEIEE